MTAQLANGGFKIYPRITGEKNQDSLQKIKYKIKQSDVKAKEKIKKTGKNVFPAPSSQNGQNGGT